MSGVVLLLWCVFFLVLAVVVVWCLCNMLRHSFRVTRRRYGKRAARKELVWFLGVWVLVFAATVLMP